MTLTDASLRQILAANPDSSTWLSANAGSGKTRVLTDRVARLLLRDVSPQRILCLTYTKAAASEMQNRLFRTLGQWAMKPDGDLQQTLTDLGEDGALGADHLARARRLFARAIETPGGLRIQTIHSFCATLLRRFPLEAGVSPQFTELDDRTASLLRAQILEEMCQNLAPDAMDAIAQVFLQDDFSPLIQTILSSRTAFETSQDASTLGRMFDVPQGDTDAAILSDVFLGGEMALLTTLVAELRRGRSTDIGHAATLGAALATGPEMALLAVLESVFLFGAGAKSPYGAKIDTFPTQDLRKSLPHLMPQVNALMLRVEATRHRRLGQDLMRKTAALHGFARAFLPIYAERKAARGWLDFDDLITRAKALLTDRSVAAWVLFRLDGGIDHILVDEAQDTSPDQWRVIELLTAEFTAGQGSGKDLRTLFVVGDKKQSIYSFQGADVAAFDEKKLGFEAKFRAANQPFQSLALEYSFRSSPAILSVVDATFGDRFPEALGDQVLHRAFKPDLPGRVDLWPVVEPETKEKDGNWQDPVDLISPEHHHTRSAEQIADEIDRMIRSGVQIVAQDGTRPVHAGDFLILVQSRSTLFSAIIQACKARDLPIAGADRLKLGGEMAVKDLTALLSFLATPEDDLSLAAVLRSPLFGWSEAQLFDLAHGRPGYLWEALRSQTDLHPRTIDILTDLRNLSDFARPFELIERVLTRHQGRPRLITRLGAEAEDGVDELLNQALAYEQQSVPSLTGFLAWLGADEVEVKRQADSQGRRIRVMTVHGAKGLESEIVILPDTVDRKPRDHDHFLLTDDGVPVWKPSKDNGTALINAIRDVRDAQEHEENLRLLYVALTRARCWLIVTGSGKTAKGNSWHNLVGAGMLQVGAVAIGGGVLRTQTGVWPDPQPVSGRTPSQIVPLEPWAIGPPPTANRAAKPLSPSNLGGAKVLPSDTDGSADLAKARGTALHLLLQHLPHHPADDWPGLARFLVPDWDDLLPVVTPLLQDPALSHLFGPDTLAEVGLTGDVRGRRLHGAIDRLIIGPDEVLAVDYKSNLIVPDRAQDVPEGLLRQQGAYAHILQQIYPDKRVQTAILWTQTAQLMLLDAEIVRAALGRAVFDDGTDP